MSVSVGETVLYFNPVRSKREIYLYILFFSNNKTTKLNRLLLAALFIGQNRWKLSVLGM